MAKKLKKTRKGMSPKAKFTLGSAFKGIISNQACIDGSKESPWWVAAIFFVFAVIIPLIPGFVKLSKVNGADFLSSANYGLDTSLTGLTYDLYNNDHVELKASKGILHYYKDGVEHDELYDRPDQDPEYIDSYKETFKVVSENPQTLGKIELRVFLWNMPTNSKLSNYVNTVAKQKYRQDNNQPYSADDEKGTKYYTPNLIIITPHTMAVALYKYDTTSQVKTSNGGLDWYNTSNKVGLIERLNKEGVNSGDIVSEEKNNYVNTYKGKVLKQFKGLCNETYLNQKKRTKWMNTGIYAGIYAGVLVFLGLMIFVLTRGKSNPFKYLNVWHCQKIAWWASFTPALLGMILAFVFSGNMIGQMAFILLISLRVMWLSMKQLRPMYQGQ